MAFDKHQRAIWRRIRPLIVIAISAIALDLFAAGCAGHNAAAPTARPTTPSPGSPATTAPPATSASPSVPEHSPTPAPSTVAPSTAAPSTAPAFFASVSVLTPAMRALIAANSWHPGCPVSLDRLRLLRLSYWGFDHLVHQGELVVNESAADQLSYAFKLLFAARFPIRQMRTVDYFGGDDERSMLADNTSAFNCRIVPGTSVWSQHAYGLAVDINPFENPEVSNGSVDPPAAAAWADRTRSNPTMIAHGDAAWQAFQAIGWTWGGDWTSPKDYQHFSANGL